jgi:hypothetical protein
MSATSEKISTKQLEKDIYYALKKPAGLFICYEVTIGWFGKERVDVLTYDTKGTWRCYELKISKSDFRSKNHNTFVGHFNYYVMPKALYEQVKNEIPAHVGVYTEKGICAKNAKRQSLKVDEQILKNSMIRSLYRTAQDSIVHKLQGVRVEQLQYENANLKNIMRKHCDNICKSDNCNDCALWDVMSEDNKIIRGQRRKIINDNV